MVQPYERLAHSIGDKQKVYILPHTDPDPDAIASAVALQFLLQRISGRSATVLYSGIVGRAENKALVRYLGNPMKRLTRRHLAEPAALALVDTQPGSGNNALPQGCWPEIVIDHHPLRESTAAAAYAEVRPELGATSTILWEHLKAAGLEPSQQLATALFYGIKTDTMGLGRGAGEQDAAAYFDLQHRVDVDALARIENAQVPQEYFQSFAAALNATWIHDGVVYTDLGRMSYPDLAAEIADLFARLEDARWVICMGSFRGNLILAIRSRSQRQGAGQLARAIVAAQGSAGGHGAYAGGQVPIHDQDLGQLKQELLGRGLAFLGIDPDQSGQPLLPAGAG